MSRLVGALIEELADEVPDEPRLESVRADLTAASRSYESGKKKDLALRFYLHRDPRSRKRTKPPR